MNIENNYSTLESKVLSEDKTLSKKFMANVFIWRFAGLIITASVAWMFAYSSLLHLLITETGLSTLGWIVMFSPFVMVIFMSFGFNKCHFSP